MSFTQTMVWEVRTTGSDSNGGGFRGGSSLAKPSAPSLSFSNSGGAVAAGTYFFVLTYSEVGGIGQGDLETPFGGEASVTVAGGSSQITVHSPSNPAGNGMTYYNVYVSTTTGGPYHPVAPGGGNTGQCGTDFLITSTPDVSQPADQGPPGTDFSQQNGVQVTYVDLVIGTSSGQPVKLSSVAHPFTVAQVGNVVNVTSGTNFTVQRVEILNVDASGNAYVDKSLGTNGATAGHGVLGGSLASPGLAALMLEGGIDSGGMFVKAGTYTIGASNNAAGGRITNDSDRSFIVGYSTTRSRANQDSTRPLLQAGADSITLVTATHNYFLLANIVLDANTHSAVGGFAWTGSFGCLVRDCHTQGGCSTGFSSAGGALFWRCQDDASASQGFLANGSGTTFFSCEANVSGGTGFSLSGASKFGSAAIHCVAKVSAGTGFTVDTSYQYCVNCTAYDTTSSHAGNSGFTTNPASTAVVPAFINCLAVNFKGTGSFGFSFGVGTPAGVMLNCSGFNNATDFSPAGSNTTVPGAQIFNWTTLTQDPFVNGAGGDFGLNNTLGGGHSLRGAGLPGHAALTQVPGIASDSFVDVGAVQTSSLVTGLLVHPGYGGGAKG